MIYCFDLDGTLCTNTDGKYKEAAPFQDRIDIVNELYEKGNTIIIDTARGCTTGKDWSGFTINQLAEWGVKYSTLYTGTKVHADIYVDDKAISDSEFF